ncbi:MAG: hypothetical protein LBF12_05650 [Christensenellaceae bacterium]|jgi:hypothetical protein|nr:hypothetical protein [Christensenellaceae bacterium]
MLITTKKFLKKHNFFIYFVTIAFIATFMLVGIALIACINNELIFAIPDSPEYNVNKTVTATKFTTYDGPSIMKSSEDMKVNVEGHDLFVYETRVNNKRSFSFSQPLTKGYVVSFDFEGSITVTILVSNCENLTNVTVRPLAYDINTFVVENKIVFKLDYPADYTVEFSKGADDIASNNTLHIFANEIEVNPINESSIPDDTIYIGPGIYDASAIPLKTGQTLYLAGGAYVFGQIRAEYAENITIKGRGIISGSIYDRSELVQSVIPIEFADSKNINITGITILDPAGIAIALIRCIDSNVRGVNIITARANCDGISIQSCVNILVSDCFVRSWSDSLVVKDKYGESSTNIVFENSTIWTDLNESCKVGYETNGSLIKNVTFRDITILHNFHKAVMAVHNADKAHISDVYFLNITIEDAQTIGDLTDNHDDYIIEVEIGKHDKWSVTAKRGPITNVTFSNINIITTVNSAAIRLTGEDSDASLTQAIFNNLYISDSQVQSTDDLLFSTNDYINDVLFGSQGSFTNGARIKYPYNLKILNSNVSFKNIPTKLQFGVEVPAFTTPISQAPFADDKINLDAADISITHNVGFDHVNYDDGSWVVDKNSAKNLFDNDLQTKWDAPAWSGVNNEYAAISITFNKSNVIPGIVRLHLDPTNAYSIEYRIRIYNKSSSDKGFLFLKEVYSKTSPTVGNYLDIVIPKSESYTLQLRIYKGSGILGAKTLSLNEILILPLSLTTNQPVTASDSNEIYLSDYLTDGNLNTYWESIYENANIVIPFSSEGIIYSVCDIILHLPPSKIWDLRYELISIKFSLNGHDFYNFFADASYCFDPEKGNFVTIHLDTPIQATHIYVEILETSTQYGAQLSEIFVYGTPVESEINNI